MGQVVLLCELEAGLDLVGTVRFLVVVDLRIQCSSAVAAIESILVCRLTHLDAIFLHPGESGRQGRREISEEGVAHFAAPFFFFTEARFSFISMNCSRRELIASFASLIVHAVAAR